MWICSHPKYSSDRVRLQPVTHQGKPIRDDSAMHHVAPLDTDIPVAESSWTLVREVVGLAYMLTSVLLGFDSLAQFFPYMDNDYVWPHFSDAQYRTLLTDIINVQLTSSTPLTTVDLLSPSFGLVANEKVGVSYAYPRMLMYHDLTTLEAAVIGLRRLDVEEVVYMVAQYCWVDLEKRWALSHTLRRQQRCVARDMANAAVYLEPILRNIEYKAWVLSTQGLFMARIGDGVAELDGGDAWLQYVADHVPAPLDDEVAFWVSHGLSRFALQYANQYQIGLEESITIENALGLRYAFRVKTVPWANRGTHWTSDYLYAGLRNDFNALSLNQSLVRNASTFFGATYPDWMEYYNVGYPLSAVHGAIHDVIGPLASIDLRWIQPPDEIIAAVRHFRSTLLSANATVHAALRAVPEIVLHPTPLEWRAANLSFYGGSPLCGFKSDLPFVQASFGFDDACELPRQLGFEWHSANSVFAAIALGDDPVSPALCELCDDSAQCEAALSRTMHCASMLPRRQEPLLASLRAIDLSLLQFVRNGSGDVTLQVQSFSSPEWSFLGLLGVYDWVLGNREVVSFEGDNAAYTLLSYATTPLRPPVNSVGSSGVIHIWMCAGLVSLGLAFVAVLGLVFWLAFRPLRCHWFVFSRLTSAAWLSRALILLRGVAGVLCLATTPVAPAPSGLAFTATPRSLYLSSLFASEAVWITYVLHETLHPFSGIYTRLYAPLSSFVAWLALLVLDAVSPVAITAGLDRQCYSINMDYNVYCTSGSIQIGSRARTLTNFAILVASVVGGLTLVNVRKRSSIELDDVPSFLLSSASVAFLAHHSHGRVTESFDVVTAAMMGLVRFSNCYFDTKLWRIVDRELLPSASRHKRHRLVLPLALTPLSPRLRPATAPESCLQRLKRRYRKSIVVLGILYASLSLASNVAYLTVAQAFLTNDFGWAGFNSSGMHAFLANTFNHALVLSSEPAMFNVTTPAIADIAQRYNGSSSPSIVWSYTAARRALASPTTPLDQIIAGLRAMNPCMLPWMYTQYCWLDWQRNWEMASSRARQVRCELQITNGAMYLESALRNLRDWDAWDACWGTSFDIGFARHLKQSANGQHWLETIRVNTTIHDEVAAWKHANLVGFSLQWQNYKTMGFSDAFTITSALGYTAPLSLASSDGSYHLQEQTTHRMYWTVASDLWAIATNSTVLGGRSLLRASPNFAFANVTAETALLQNLTLLSPLNAGLVAVQSSLGPFGNIDTQYVLPPTSLIALYRGFSAALATLLVQNDSAQAAYTSLPPWATLYPVPSSLMRNGLSIVIIGANVMCGTDVPAYAPIYGLFRFYGAASACHANFIEAMQPTLPQLLFGFLAFDATLQLDVVDDLTAICALDGYGGSGCNTTYRTLFDFLECHVTAFQTLSNLAVATRADVAAMDVNVMQFVAGDGIADASVGIFRMQLLEPDDRHWAFYGWCFLYEWALGLREVVAFAGDRGNFSLLSSHVDAQHMRPNPSEVPVSFSLLCKAFNFYVSWVLICVASLVAVSALVRGGAVEGVNFFCLNRVVGHVWAGRTFLIVRSVSAIWLLTTSPLYLASTGIATTMVAPSLFWYDNILAASEVSWLVYVLNDVFTVVSRQHTALYASKSSLLTSLLVSLWTFLSPQRCEVNIARHCVHVDMDFALDCSSVNVHVGSLRRLGGVLGLAVGSILGCFLFGRYVYAPNEPPIAVRSWLLSAQSYYLLDFTNWVFLDEYYLDTTSAMMAGILSFVYNGRRYVFDIKMWRLVSLPHNPISLWETDARRFRHAIPLSRI
ncbi:hypothetical protein SDRG_01611 [Saprolegnia diclina VS20]|uniref:Uncharacterized protein n=1 Tax=Saprolegnia diclina (strain VS20) TaxID=1156394 RepID=T0S8N8_SAPDV|nr:hypothetical protein SDRG_01611 [Saprolegnia diclina VS20]EQC41653.1 hypothetical protein SDRG_01611 [Saprolegnia diclina VS20]|eukprot:XP_008605367.1 hypothetical protein SDRG_01611 [Saprolegnia diclina VS20]